VRPSHRVTGDRRDSVDGADWEVLHLAVDDHSRLAYTEVLPDEKKQSATAFLFRALAWFADHGVTAERVMTDNGSAYRSKLWRRACRALEVRHLRTRPYTPGPTVRPNASSRPPCASGPMCGPISIQQNGEPSSPSGTTTTITSGRIGIGRKPPISWLGRNNLLSHDN
jgi:hypothetical protein